MTTIASPVPSVAHDTFPINGTDYIEFWVGNAKQSAMFYRTAFGFQLVGVPRAGDRACATARATCCSRTRSASCSRRRSGPEGPIAEHVRLHGDGVRDLAFWVDDARDAHAKAVARGARSVQEPTVHAATPTARSSSRRSRPTATRSTRIVERRNYTGIFLPGFVPKSSPLSRRAHRAQVRRPLRRQRRARQDERVGRVLRARARASTTCSRSTTRTSPPSTRR